MTHRTQKDLRQILHPYMFVLKEGKKFHQDLLDYSLVMLHVNCLEVMQSPSLPNPTAAQAQEPGDAAVIASQSSDFITAVTGISFPSNH